MKKTIIIIIVVILSIIIEILAISPFGYRKYTFEPSKTVVLLNISKDGVGIYDAPNTTIWVSKGSRAVTYYDKDLGYDYPITKLVSSKFLEENGVLDLKQGDEMVMGLYTTYYRPGIVFSALMTIVNIIDVKTPHEGNPIVIPFTKQVYNDETYFVSKDSTLLKQNN